MKKRHIIAAMLAALSCCGWAKSPLPVDLDGSEADVLTFPAQATNYDYAGLKREQLGRGLVAWRSDTNTVTVSWRYLSSDPRDIAFDVYRDGEAIATNLTTSTQFDYADTDAATSHTYTLYSDGEKLAETKSYTTIGYIEIPISAPPSGKTPDGNEYSLIPWSCSIGDVDGDGEYEIFLIWTPTISGGHWRYTGVTYYECFKLDGTKVWGGNRICLGTNFHSSANGWMLAVGDFNSDGKCEFAIKTCPGTVDAAGVVFGDTAEITMARIKGENTETNWTSYVNNSGQVLEGAEYLTIFDGATGKALYTVDYVPARGEKSTWKNLWGDNFGNRMERYQLSGAYLDGTNLSIVACRGIYKRTGITAWDWDGEKLIERWRFDTTNTALAADINDYRGQGYHSMSVADVDFDGKDEILYGSMTIDDDGTPKYTTKMGHGDSERVIQADPRERGLQMFVCLESNPYGCALYDLETGEIKWRVTAGGDTGRAVAGDIDGSNPGCEMWASGGCGLFDQYGNQLIQHDFKNKYYGLSLSLLIWWSGELARDQLGGSSYVATYSLADKARSEVYYFQGAHSINSSFSTPCIEGDILGDWREEAIFPATDNSALRIYLSPMPTNYRFWTFLEDPVYRHSLSNECLCHNMGSMPGFYFGPDLKGHGIWFRGCYIK